MRKLTHRFKQFLGLISVDIATVIVALVFPSLPTPPLGVIEIAFGVSLLFLARCIANTPRFLMPKPEPFWNAKAQVIAWLAKFDPLPSWRPEALSNKLETQ